MIWCDQFSRWSEQLNEDSHEANQQPMVTACSWKTMKYANVNCGMQELKTSYEKKRIILLSN